MNEGHLTVFARAELLDLLEIVDCDYSFLSQGTFAPDFALGDIALKLPRLLLSLLLVNGGGTALSALEKLIFEIFWVAEAFLNSWAIACGVVLRGFVLERFGGE